MSAYSESGHARNVANFEGLYASTLSFGLSYLPTKASCKPAAVNALLASSKASLAALNNSRSTLKTARDVREQAFSGLGKLATRIKNSLLSSGASDITVDSLKTFTRLLTGKRAKRKLTEEEQKKAEEKKGKKIIYISASRMSYDNQLDNFDRMIKFLQGCPTYNPNETDLKISTLLAIYADLKNKNATVATALANMNLAMINRNDLLYKDDVGLVDVAQDIKTYVKSAYGLDSLQAKTVCRFKFVNYNKY